MKKLHLYICTLFLLSNMNSSYASERRTSWVTKAILVTAFFLTPALATSDNPYATACQVVPNPQCPNAYGPHWPMLPAPGDQAHATAREDLLDIVSVRFPVQPLLLPAPGDKSKATLPRNKPNTRKRKKN